MSTNALPDVSVGATVPMREKVAVPPLARSMPLHSNWSVPTLENVVPPTELVANSAVNPLLSVSTTVALVAADGPWLVRVIV